MQIKDIKELIEIFENSNMEFLEVDIDDTHIKMKKPKPVILGNVQAPVLVNNAQPVQEVEEKYTPIKSPVVGIFYVAPSPDKEPFIKVGQKISKGDVIGLIEAMKVMSEIKASCDGIVKEILVVDEQMVAFDDVLMRVEE